jgi:hypothetical protein
MPSATWLAYLSGLAFVAPGLPPGTIVGTTLVLHTCDAVLCRRVALNNGYPRGLCTTIGFLGGIWAVAVLIVLPRRRPAAPR